MMITTAALVWVIVICAAGALLTWRAAEYYRAWMGLDASRLERSHYRRSERLHRGLFLLFCLGLLWGIGTLLLGVPDVDRSIPARLERSPDASVTQTENTGITPQSQGTLEGVLPAAVTPSPTPASMAMVANTDGLGVNMRQEPGLGTEIVTVVPEGTRVVLNLEIRVVNNIEWQSVTLADGSQGWIASPYLTPLTSP